jgi:hypothetical protein
MDRQIIARFDNKGIFVYQAFKNSIADEALSKGTFGKGFNLNRRTWIKPSFGWMLYRSNYATKHRQERILRVKISHEGFQTIISKGVPTAFELGLFKTQDEWHRALRNSDVCYQWDPDRDIRLRRLDRRAIQIGMRGIVVREYVDTWIIGIEDVTELAHAIKATVDKKFKKMPPVPEECVYEVSPELQRILAMKRHPDTTSPKMGNKQY